MIKKTMKLIVLILLIVFSIKIIRDLSYSGTKEVLIIENYNEISSLDELINLPQYEDKILYINVYNLYCNASLKQFISLRKVMERSNMKEVIYIHLATPKMTFTSSWKLTVKEQGLKGHHLLMNSAFYEELWTHFPHEKGKYTPVYIGVGEDKKVTRIQDPISIVKKVVLNDCNLKIAKYVLKNIDSIKPSLLKATDNLRITIDFKRNGYIERISCFSVANNTASNTENSIQVWRGLDLEIGKIFNAVLDKKINFKKSIINLPIDASELGLMIAKSEM